MTTDNDTTSNWLLLAIQDLERHGDGTTLEAARAALAALEEREGLRTDVATLEQIAQDRADMVAGLTQERDALRRQLDGAEARVRELEAEGRRMRERADWEAGLDAFSTTDDEYHAMRSALAEIAAGCPAEKAP